MKVAHRYHWHYAPPIYPDGDTQLWCKWCGFRQTIKQRHPYEIWCGNNLTKKFQNQIEQGMARNMDDWKIYAELDKAFEEARH